MVLSGEIQGLDYRTPLLGVPKSIYYVMQKELMTSYTFNAAA